ncbi:Rep [uncultured virus]|uniref:Rep n=1 Tax=uncultured virus TaxID=340016 RepID=A0A2K9LS86_9VIRU|nr:Rep [uncultured virus]
MYTWQRELAAEAETPPDKRKIVWYYDQAGGSGKTEMAKFLLGTCDSAIFLSGGGFKDISYQIVRAKKDPRIIILNLPRTSEGKVSYASLEAAKDGLVQSGKYEGGWRLFPNPHVYVFANFMPDLASLSADRWTIRVLDNNEIIE